ncbi:MAG: energy transducer TonB [Acidobacteriales bacterium]|nr:energy transducer TonB [Terriglobales bacterium]
MWLNSRVVFRVTFAVLICFHSLLVWADDKRDRAKDLINRWNAQLDLRAPTSTPFHLKGKFQLTGMKTGEVSGTWDEVYFAPNKWRLEIAFPGYEEVLVRNGPDHYWRKRSGEPEPLRITQAKDLFGLRRPVRPAALEYKIDEVRDRKFENQTFTCVRRKLQHLREEMCFDSEGRLTRSERLGEQTLLREYSDYADLGGKQVPTTMRLRIAGTDAVRAEVIALQPHSGSASAMLTPDSSFEMRPACDVVTFPKPEHTPDPDYPDPRFSGTVALTGEVGLDGRLHNAAVLQTAGSRMDSAALEAVRQWRFKPATCKGVPIPFELTVEVNFKGFVR